MATLTRTIAASADDFNWSDYNDYFASDSLHTYAGFFHTAYQSIQTGMAFQNITIPAGSTITLARVRFTASVTNSSTTVNTKWSAYDEDNPTVPTTLSAAVNAPRTTAVVTHSNLPAWTSGQTYDSPDLSTIIQEIIDRPGWDSGNRIVLFHEDNGTTAVNSTTRQGHSFDNTGTEPELYIEYTEPASTPDTPTNVAVSLGNVSWDTMPDTTSYDVRHSTNQSTWTIVNGVTSPWSHTPRAAGTTFYYQVRACNANGCSAWSASVSDTSLASGQYKVIFTPTDTYSTNIYEIVWQVRTATGGGGTLVASGNTTSGVQTTTDPIDDAGLVHGANTRYLRLIDGAGNALDQSFNVQAELNQTYNEVSSTASLMVTQESSSVLGLVMNHLTESTTVGSHEDSNVLTMVMSSLGSPTLIGSVEDSSVLYSTMTVEGPSSLVGAFEGGSDVATHVDTLGSVQVQIIAESDYERLQMYSLGNAIVLPLHSLGTDTELFVDSLNLTTILFTYGGTDSMEEGAEEFNELDVTLILSAVTTGIEAGTWNEVSDDPVLIGFVIEGVTGAWVWNDVETVITLPVYSAGTDLEIFGDITTVSVIRAITTATASGVITETFNVTPIGFVGAGLDRVEFEERGQVQVLASHELGADTFTMIHTGQVMVVPAHSTGIDQALYIDSGVVSVLPVFTGGEAGFFITETENPVLTLVTTTGTALFGLFELANPAIVPVFTAGTVAHNQVETEESLVLILGQLSGFEGSQNEEFQGAIILRMVSTGVDEKILRMLRFYLPSSLVVVEPYEASTLSVDNPYSRSTLVSIPPFVATLAAG